MANEKRLIDAYSLAEQVWESKDKNPHRDIKIARNHSLEHEHFLKMICLAPTVDAVEVVHAKWVLVGDGVGCCSNCHRLDSIDKLATHCRCCGAKMDGDGNG